MSPSHYLNQCWNIVNWTLRNKPQWNFDQHSYIFIKKNAFENLICKMAAILSQPECVNNNTFSIFMLEILYEKLQDDVVKWKHFPHYWSFVQGIHRSPVKKRPVTQSFDVFFDLHPNRWLSKQWWGWWFEMPWCPLWRHRNDIWW